MANKIFDAIFFVEVTKQNEKSLYQMKVGIKIGKVKKFGIGWCILHRMAADNAKGGSVRTPPYGIGLNWIEINQNYQCAWDSSESQT